MRPKKKKENTWELEGGLSLKKNKQKELLNISHARWRNWHPRDAQLILFLNPLLFLYVLYHKINGKRKKKKKSE